MRGNDASTSHLIYQDSDLVQVPKCSTDYDLMVTRMWKPPPRSLTSHHVGRRGGLKHGSSNRWHCRPWRWGRADPRWEWTWSNFAAVVQGTCVETPAASAPGSLFHGRTCFMQTLEVPSWCVLPLFLFQSSLSYGFHIRSFLGKPFLLVYKWKACSVPASSHQKPHRNQSTLSKSGVVPKN